MKKVSLILFCCLLLLIQNIFAIDVTIDSTKKYQTIEGLGTAIASHMLGLHDNEELIKMLATDLGMSMLRLYPAPSFEPENDNEDPNVIDWSKMKFADQTDDGPIMGRHLSIIKKFLATGMPPRVILSVFTPAAWMKTGLSEIGGRLNPEMYDEFAEFYSAYIQGLKDSTGVDVYAISPQNEPRWEQWYESCMYSFEEMRDIIKVLGARFENDQIDVKLFAAEDLMGEAWYPWTQPWSEYYEVMMADPVARDYCDVVAVHAYEDGVMPSSPSATLWNEVYEAVDSLGKSVWMTETSGYDEEWLDALVLSNAIYSALRYGNCSAWIWLNAAMQSEWNAQEGLILFEEDGTVNYTHKYYAAKQYFRFIRPGAVRINAESNDDLVQALAFVHHEENTKTLVLSNRGREDKEVILSGMDLSGLKIIRSSETENSVELGNATSSMTLPARSITTLYSGAYTAVETQSEKPEKFNLKQNYPNPFNPETFIQYSLDKADHVQLNIYNILGKQVKTLVAENQGAGRYTIAWDGTNFQGIPLSSGSYVYELKTSDIREVKKMVLMR